MNQVSAEQRADAARAALQSDIQEIKEVSHALTRKFASKTPWLIGGAVAVVAVGVALALRPGRSVVSFGRPRRSLLGRAVRAAALSALGVVTRRLVLRTLNETLPEPNAKGRARAMEATQPGSDVPDAKW